MWAGRREGTCFFSLIFSLSLFECAPAISVLSTAAGKMLVSINCGAWNSGTPAQCNWGKNTRWRGDGQQIGRGSILEKSSPTSPYVQILCVLNVDITVYLLTDCTQVPIGPETILMCCLRSSTCSSLVLPRRFSCTCLDYSNADSNLFLISFKSWWRLSATTVMYSPPPPSSLSFKSPAGFHQQLSWFTCIWSVWKSMAPLAAAPTRQHVGISRGFFLQSFPIGHSLDRIARAWLAQPSRPVTLNRRPPFIRLWFNIFFCLNVKKM